MNKLIILTLIALLSYAQSTFSSSSVKPQPKRNNVVSATEMATMIDTAKETVFYDIRPYIEYSIFHAPKSVNLPMQYLNNRMDEVKKYKQVVLIANEEKEAALAMQMIKARFPEINVKILAGGVGSWVQAGFTINNDLPHGC
jgi:rhodanese-related sulfurtransferase